MNWEHFEGHPQTEGQFNEFGEFSRSPSELSTSACADYCRRLSIIAFEGNTFNERNMGTFLKTVDILPQQPFTPAAIARQLR